MSKLIWVGLPLLVLGGCKDNGVTLQPSPAVFRVDLQSQFLDDSVRLTVDSRTVFSGRVTTNSSLGLARSISVDANIGEHTVLVEVIHPYRGAEKDTTVSVTDTLTVGVTLDERSRMLYFHLYRFLIPYR